MTTSLSKEDRLNIIEQHIRNVELGKYNLDLSIIEESSVATPNSTSLDSLNAQKDDLDAKLTSLKAEFTAVESEA